VSVVVFSGPTIDAAAVRRVLPDAICRGPASRGDVYLASKLRPSAIALIDGYFGVQGIQSDLGGLCFAKAT